MVIDADRFYMMIDCARWWSMMLDGDRYMMDDDVLRYMKIYDRLRPTALHDI